MRKLISLLLTFLFALTQVNAQSAEISHKRNVQFDATTLKKNAIYLSLGAGAQNLIYEVNIANAPRAAWYFKTGLGYNQAIFASNSQHILAGITYLTGRKRKSHFELSTATFFMFDSQDYRLDQDMHYQEQNITDYLHVNPGLYMGYRYQKPGGRFILRYGYGFPEITSLSLGLAF